jgi:hypothetical protein
MQSLFRLLLCLLALTLMVVALESKCFADSMDSNRDSLQEEYKNHRGKHPSLFATAPIFHVIPDKNLVTLSADYRYLDTAIIPEKSTYGEGQNHLQLNLDGWHSSVLTAFSARAFGIGFSAELGEKFVSYGLVQDAVPIQQSKVRFSGLGTYVYHTPTIKFLPKFSQFTFMLGYRKIEVLHQYSGYNRSYESELRPFRYQVQKIDYGTNLALNLAKHFTVFPWLNWRHTILGSPENPRVDSMDLSLEPEKSFFYSDQELLWASEPRLSYGVDFAIKWQRLDIHLGGLFGLLANFSRGNEQISENGASISASFTFKSH